MKSPVRLVKPNSRFRKSFLSLIEEYRQAGEQKYVTLYEEAQQDFDAYLKKLRKNEKGVDLPEGWVPSSVFWLIDATEEVLGVVRIRHRLTPFLELIGGHIGYDVRPSSRGQGYGNESLRLSLEKARHLGLKRVMLTCDTDNIRSQKIIEKFAGKLQDTVLSPESNRRSFRFWIELSGPTV